MSYCEGLWLRPCRPSRTPSVSSPWRTCCPAGGCSIACPCPAGKFTLHYTIKCHPPLLVHCALRERREVRPVWPAAAAPSRRPPAGCRPPGSPPAPSRSSCRRPSPGCCWRSHWSSSGPWGKLSEPEYIVLVQVILLKVRWMWRKKCNKDTCLLVDIMFKSEQVEWLILSLPNSSFIQS